MAHPYAELITQEAARADADLAAFRSRALTVVTTSSGIVTLLTGLTTFAASKTDEEVGLVTDAIILVGIALGLFVLASVLALIANAPVTIQRPKGADLLARTENEKWHDGDPTDEHERVTSRILAVYLISVRKVSDRAAVLLSLSTACQILGLTAAAASTIVTLTNL